MSRGLVVLWAFVIAMGGVGAEPRVFAPVYLRLGALNEVYVWDEAPVGAFTLELVRPGAPHPLVRVPGFSVDRPLTVLGAGNRPLRWSAALVGLDALESPGPVVARFLGPGGKVLAEVPSEIRPRAYPTEKIPLDKAMTELRTKPDKKKDREAAEIWKVYQKFEANFPWAGGRFLLPVDPSSVASAQFGDIRDYLYFDGTTSRDYHRGTDFAVPVGTPVRAAASGRVVLAAQRILTGNTLVLEHAPGVYSVYFHLSKISVKLGQKVGAGDPIALSGATGFVTGPHLHWEVRIGGVPVDPLDLVIDGLLDTNLVSAVVSSSERFIH